MVLYGHIQVILTYFDHDLPPFFVAVIVNGFLVLRGHLLRYPRCVFLSIGNPKSFCRNLFGIVPVRHPGTFRGICRAAYTLLPPLGPKVALFRMLVSKEKVRASRSRSRLRARSIIRVRSSL